MDTIVFYSIYYSGLFNTQIHKGVNMTWEEISTWMTANWFIPAAIIVGCLVYIYSKIKENKKKEELAKLKEQQIQQPVNYGEVRSFGTPYLEKPFMNLNFTPLTKLDQYKKLREDVRKEINEKMQQWNFAKEKYQEMVLMEKTIRENIDFLAEREHMYDEAIKHEENVRYTEHV